ncbi:MAG: MCP four helix bundle domain-containing protein [Cyclobacteriaceae bacterium]
MKRNKFLSFRIKIAIALSLILFLIFAKSLVDKSNVDELEASFISVYEDRLVVQDYIFNITELLFRMKLLVANTASFEEYVAVKDQVLAYHDQILNIIADFEKTNLTPKESEYLKEFKSLIKDKLEVESYFSNLNEPEKNYKTSIENFNSDFERVFYDLKELSKIQLREGEKLTNLSYRIKARSDIWLQFEYAVLFVLLIIISMLIYSARSFPKKEFVE